MSNFLFHLLIVYFYVMSIRKDTIILKQILCHSFLITGFPAAFVTVWAVAQQLWLMQGG